MDFTISDSYLPALVGWCLSLVMHSVGFGLTTGLDASIYSAPYQFKIPCVDLADLPAPFSAKQVTDEVMGVESSPKIVGLNLGVLHFLLIACVNLRECFGEAHRR